MMTDYYKLDIIPIILKIFKVNTIIVSGLSDESIYNQILTYCSDFNASYTVMDLYEKNENAINDFTLNALINLNEFDTIFLNDDPNWYTVFNELNLVKENKEEFPLVFICNNIFPHKRRDSYTNPNIIPKEFLNDYSDELVYGDITIKDGFFHAIKDGTPKNGVLTAIEDFLKENSSVDMMDIKFLNGITILYKKDSISHSRIGKILEEIKGYVVEYEDASDNIIENQMLTNNLLKNNMYDVEELKIDLDNKNKLISDFEDQIKIHGTELNYKNSQIENVYSKLDLKETQLKNMESKLFNQDVEIDGLHNQLEKLHTEINSLKSQIEQNENNEINLNNQIKAIMSEIHEKEQKFNLIKKQYINQLYKLDNKEYCINCYKEEINNNRLEIEYLNHNTLTRRILNPFSYFYLIFQSKPNELLINFKLYKAIKNSKCFDIGFYLNNNEDIQKSKWCRYFSPELHYVCNGFREQRKFNKKYFNRNSKKELLNYILNSK